MGAFIFQGCSNDNNVVSAQEEFVKAKVNGADYLVKSSDIIECKKILTNYGSMSLTVKVENEEGNIMEFLILNYSGANVYPIGEKTYFLGGSGVDGNWMKYSETYPQLGIWITNKNIHLNNRAHFEITNDNGNYLSGTFSFDAEDVNGETLRSISDGKFLFEIDR